MSRKRNDLQEKLSWARMLPDVLPTDGRPSSSPGLDLVVSPRFATVNVVSNMSPIKEPQRWALLTSAEAAVKHAAALQKQKPAAHFHEHALKSSVAPTGVVGNDNAPSVTAKANLSRSEPSRTWTTRTDLQKLKVELQNYLTTSPFNRNSSGVGSPSSVLSSDPATLPLAETFREARQAALQQELRPTTGVSRLLRMKFDPEFGENGSMNATVKRFSKFASIKPSHSIHLKCDMASAPEQPAVRPYTTASITSVLNDLLDITTGASYVTYSADKTEDSPLVQEAIEGLSQVEDILGARPVQVARLSSQAASLNNQLAEFMYQRKSTPSEIRNQTRYVESELQALKAQRTSSMRRWGSGSNRSESPLERSASDGMPHHGSEFGDGDGDLWRGFATSQESFKRFEDLSKIQLPPHAIHVGRALDPRIKELEEGERDEVSYLRHLKHSNSIIEVEDITYTTLCRTRPTTPAPNSLMEYTAQGLSDKSSALLWDNRGIGPQKMRAVQDELALTPGITSVHLAGNKLTNECVTDIMLILSEPGMPKISSLDISTNTLLTWRCALPIALALGWNPPPEEPIDLGITRVHSLTKLVVSGVKLGDKGAAQLSLALKGHTPLKHLDISRCGITDAGGMLLLEALSASQILESIDISWNTLRGESARTLGAALVTNPSLTWINLGHNGFSDLDAARILKGLLKHTAWQGVDLSYNNLSIGSCLICCELLEALAEVTAERLMAGMYPLLSEKMPELRGTRDFVSPYSAPKLGASRSLFHSAPPRRTNKFGDQVHSLPLWLDVAGNPLGSSGLGVLLDSLNTMSHVLDKASNETLHGTHTPIWPIKIKIDQCNVTIANKSSGSSANGVDMNGPNPWLPSILSITGLASPVGIVPAPRPSSPGKKDKPKPKKKENKKKKKKKEEVKTPMLITSAFQRLDLFSPSGRYSLDLSHPASAVVITKILKKRESLMNNPAAQEFAVSLEIHDIQLNQRPVKLEKLANCPNLAKGLAEFTVKCPSLLDVGDAEPVLQPVVEWLLECLGHRSVTDLWRLSVLDVACAQHCYTAEQVCQLLEMFDPQIGSSERIAAAVSLYVRTVQPLEFWTDVLPTMTPQHKASVKEKVGDLGALNITAPAGRYVLNLSRSLNRLVVLRLQAAASLETRWKQNKCFVCWRNTTLNGQALNRDALTKLRDFTIPNSGLMRLDYVTYKVPGPADLPCEEQVLCQLLRALRQCYRAFHDALLDIRHKYLSGGRIRAEMESAKAKADFRPASLRIPPTSGLGGIELPSIRSSRQSQPAAEDSAASAAAVDQSWWHGTTFNAGPLMRRFGVPWSSNKRASSAPSPLPAYASIGLDSSRPATPSAADKSPNTRSSSYTSLKVKPMSAGDGNTENAAQEKWEVRKYPFMAFELLNIASPAAVADYMSHMSMKHGYRVLLEFLNYEGGARVVARVLEALSPVIAAHYVSMDLYDVSPYLLPLPSRNEVLAALKPEVIRVMYDVVASMNEAAIARTRQARELIQIFVAQHYVSTQQLKRVLNIVKVEADRIAAMVGLWSRIVDRPNIKEVYRGLDPEEQAQVMFRLGHYNVWSTLVVPDGLFFKIDMLDPEQREVAKEIIRIAVRTSMHAKSDKKKRGITQAAQQLLGLRGNGNLISVPEDDKMWTMIESNFHSLEFTYAMTPEQEQWLKAESAVKIQRKWRSIEAREMQKQLFTPNTPLPPVFQRSLSGRLSEDGVELPIPSATSSEDLSPKSSASRPRTAKRNDE